MKYFTKKVATILLIALLIMSLSACGRLSSKQVTELLQENGYDFGQSGINVVLDEDLSNETSGLISKGNKFVLLKIDDQYAWAVINLKEKSVYDIKSIFPLSPVKKEISYMAEDVNVKLFQIAKKYIEDYGIDCLGEKEYAEKCLQEITDNGIISVVEAQEIVNNAIYEVVDSKYNPTALFEEDSAVPVYYAVQTSELVYNWDHVFPEVVYNVWKTTTDRQSQSVMTALNGQPYVLKTVWGVTDTDLNEVGTYSSLEEAKEQLLGKNSNKSNVSKNDETLSGSKSNSENKTNKKGKDDFVIGITDYAPFNYYEENELVGFDTELAKYICNELGLNPIFKEIDWDEKESLLNSNEVDCIMNYFTYTDERATTMTLSDVYLTCDEYDEDFDEFYSEQQVVIAFKKGDRRVAEFDLIISKAKSENVIGRLVDKYRSSFEAAHFSNLSW